MHTLRDIELEAASDLDPEGSGVQTSTLAKSILHMVKAECGYLSRNGEQLMREGAQRRAGRYQAPRRRLAQHLRSTTNQRDMLELDPGFAFFIQEWIGLGETEDAVRKPILKMTLPEFEAAIRLHERKAEETAAQAVAMRKVLLNNPTWRSRPKLTLEKLLKIVLVEEVSPAQEPMPAAGQPGAPA